MSSSGSPQIVLSWVNDIPTLIWRNCSIDLAVGGILEEVIFGKGSAGTKAEGTCARFTDSQIELRKLSIARIKDIYANIACADIAHSGFLAITLSHSYLYLAIHNSHGINRQLYSGVIKTFASLEIEILFIDRRSHLRNTIAIAHNTP